MEYGLQSITACPLLRAVINLKIIYLPSLKINIFGQKCRHILQEPDKFYIRVTQLIGGLSNYLNYFSVISVSLSRTQYVVCLIKRRWSFFKKKPYCLMCVAVKNLSRFCFCFRMPLQGFGSRGRKSVPFR